MKERRLYQEALRFYEPLQQVVDYVDRSYLIELASCYEAMGLSAEVEECYRSILDRDNGDSEARMLSAQIRGELRLSEDDSANDFNSMRTRKQTSMMADANERATPAGEPTNAMLAPLPPPKRPKKVAVERVVVEDDDLDELFTHWQSLSLSLRQNEPGSKDQWMTTTQRLVKNFMDEKTFFPQQKHNEFMGFSRQALYLSRRKMHEKASATDFQPEIGESSLVLKVVRDELTGVLNADCESAVVPDEYRAIPFKDWLDIFLEYGLSFAHEGDLKQAYRIMTSATQANVFYHSPDSLFLIHVCWFSKSLDFGLLYQKLRSISMRLVGE